jgi:flagellar export protein FliJ
VTRKTRQIKTVQWLAARAERDAAEKLIASGRELEELQQTLQQLEAGRQDYVAQLSGGARMGVARMRELHGFISKIDLAIAQVRTQLAQKEQTNHRHREHWQGEKKRTQALDGVADRYRREEARVAEARLQREIDDRPPRRSA